MPSVLALLSRSFYDEQVTVGRRSGDVGDVAALTSYVSSHQRLSALGTGDALFLVAVRQPGERLLLVAVLEAPTFTDGGWQAAANELPIADVTHLVGRLRFDNGKGLTAGPGKLAMALQTPRVLAEADVAALRHAAAAGPPAPARVDVDAVTKDLLRCAELAPTDPAAAFDLAVALWRQTRWPHLAALVTQFASAAESDTARLVRQRIGQRKLPQELWLSMEASLPDVDRGALLAAPETLKIAELHQRLERIAEWAPDPRVSATLTDLLVAHPWTSQGADRMWSAVRSILAAHADPRTLDAARRIVASAEASGWADDGANALAQALAARPPAPAEPAVDALVAELTARPSAVGPGAGAAGPARGAALPGAAAVRSSAGAGFAEGTVTRVVERGGRRLVVQQRPEGDTGEWSAILVVGPDDTLELTLASCYGIGTLDPTGRILAAYTMDTVEHTDRLTLTLVEVATGARLARLPVYEHHRPRSWNRATPRQLEWPRETEIVLGAEYAGLRRYDVATGVIGELAGGGIRLLGVDPGRRLVVSAQTAVTVHDLGTGDLLQAFDLGTVGDVRPLGDGRFALLSNVDAEDRSRQLTWEVWRRHVHTIDAATGWTESVEAAPDGPPTSAPELPAQRPLPLPTVDHVAVSADGAVVAVAVGCVAGVWGERPKPARITSSAADNTVRALAVSASGHTAVAMRSQAEVRTRAGKKHGILRCGRNRITHLAGCWAHDRLAAATAGRQVFLVDADLSPRAELSSGGPDIRALAWSAAGDRVGVGTDRGLLVFDEASGERILDVVTTEPVRAALFTPGGDHVVVWLGDRLAVAGIAGAAVVDWRHRPGMTAVAGHPTLGWVAVGHDDGRVVLCSPGHDGETDLGLHFGPVTALAFARDRLVVGAGRPGRAGSLTVHEWAEEANR